MNSIAAHKLITLPVAYSQGTYRGIKTLPPNEESKIHWGSPHPSYPCNICHLLHDVIWNDCSKVSKQTNVLWSINKSVFSVWTTIGTTSSPWHHLKRAQKISSGTFTTTSEQKQMIVSQHPQRQFPIISQFPVPGTSATATCTQIPLPLPI